jgi:hypothetical protein
VLSAVVANDARSPLPVIEFFLTNNLSGGWEGWLQVAYARAVMSAGLQVEDFNREVLFPLTAQRCDLFFRPQRGADMWVELKTQRRANYTATVDDFSGDILKIINLNAGFKNTNVLVATAILKLQANDAQKLNTLRLSVMQGTMNYQLFTAGSITPWLDVTNTILTTTTNAGQLLVATYRAN